MRELGIGFDCGYIADVALAEGAGVIEGASTNSVKYPTADGQRIKGVVAYAVDAGEEVLLRRAGIAKLLTSGAFSAGDELIVTASTGAFKKADTTLGETHSIAAIAEETNGASDVVGYGKLVDESKIVVPLVIATADPGVTDDDYNVGQLWYNTTDNSLWACTGNSTGAATWFELGDAETLRAGEMHVTTADPGANNDGVDTATLGKKIAVGALWLNTTDGGLFWCDNNSTGAAVWNEVSWVGHTHA